MAPVYWAMTDKGEWIEPPPRFNNKYPGILRMETCFGAMLSYAMCNMWQHENVSIENDSYCERPPAHKNITLKVLKEMVELTCWDDHELEIMREGIEDLDNEKIRRRLYLAGEIARLQPKIDAYLYDVQETAKPMRGLMQFANIRLITSRVQEMAKELENLL